MGEVKEVSSKVLLPRPTFRDVIIENPLFEKTAEIRETLEKMPEKSRDQYLKDNLDTAWDRVLVVKCSKDCTEVKEGDFVMADPNTIAMKGMPIYEGKYIQVTESAIKGIW